MLIVLWQEEILNTHTHTQTHMRRGSQTSRIRDQFYFSIFWVELFTLHLVWCGYVFTSGIIFFSQVSCPGTVSYDGFHEFCRHMTVEQNLILPSVQLLLESPARLSHQEDPAYKDIFLHFVMTFKIFKSNQWSLFSYLQQDAKSQDRKPRIISHVKINVLPYSI